MKFSFYRELSVGDVSGAKKGVEMRIEVAKKDAWALWW